MCNVYILFYRYYYVQHLLYNNIIIYYTYNQINIIIVITITLCILLHITICHITYYTAIIHVNTYII